MLGQGDLLVRTLRGPELLNMPSGLSTGNSEECRHPRQATAARFLGYRATAGMARCMGCEKALAEWTAKSMLGEADDDSSDLRAG